MLGHEPCQEFHCKCHITLYALSITLWMIVLIVLNQNINAMNIIWAFNFNKAKDPFTKEDKVYDLHDFARVGLC